MNCEKSCGAVVFQKNNGEIKYLLISSLEGIYGFPKGHMEGNETEIETALREVKEETNLDIRLVDGFRTSTEYMLPRKKDTLKKVVYFLGNFDGGEIIYQREELSGISLVGYEEAMHLLPFEDSRRILREANDFINGIE